MYELLFTITQDLLQYSEVYKGVALYINWSGEGLEHIMTDESHYTDHLEQFLETQDDSNIKQIVEFYNDKADFTGKDPYGRHWVKDENSENPSWILKKWVETVRNTNGTLESKVFRNPAASHLGDDGLLKKIINDENFRGFR